MDNNNNPYSQQFVQNQDTSQQATPQPGNLGYVPSTPEVVSETTSIVETPTIEKAPEVQPTQEISIQPAVPTPQVATNTPAVNLQQQQVDKTGKQIVDKTKDVTKLHHIQQTHDKLTSIADTEEEEFISEVETAHGHK